MAATMATRSTPQESSSSERWWTRRNRAMAALRRDCMHRPGRARSGSVRAGFRAELATLPTIGCLRPWSWAMVDGRVQFDEVSRSEARKALRLGDRRRRRHSPGDRKAGRSRSAQREPGQFGSAAGRGLAWSRRLSDSCSFVENPFVDEGARMTQADRIIGRVAASILSQRLADARQAEWRAS